MADIGTEFELGEGILVLGLVVVIGYGLYKAFGSLGTALNTLLDDVSSGAKKAYDSISTSASQVTDAFNQSMQGPTNSELTNLVLNSGQAEAQASQDVHADPNYDQNAPGAIGNDPIGINAVGG